LDGRLETLLVSRGREQLQANPSLGTSPAHWGLEQARVVVEQVRETYGITASVHVHFRAAYGTSRGGRYPDNKWAIRIAGAFGGRASAEIVLHELAHVVALWFVFKGHDHRTAYAYHDSVFLAVLRDLLDRFTSITRTEFDEQAAALGLHMDGMSFQAAALRSRAAACQYTPPATLAARPTPKPSVRRKARAFEPGATLTREYKGVVYEVRILADGVAYEGRAFRSLTAVAKEITGYKSISGTNFFGVDG